MITDIRKLLEFDVPGIIPTGDVSPTIIREAQANRLQVLHKPAKPEGLLALIDQLLAGAECRGSDIAG